MKQKGLCVVISGPAGSGKGTVVNEILKISPEYAYSVSAATRSPRPGEVDGVNYFFISKEEFEEKIKNGEMLEYTNYCGNYYGTPKEKVVKALEDKNILLEIEVEGALNVKKALPEAVLIMLLPPDAKTLEQRLRGRGTETDEVIKKRLARAKEEISLFENYDYAVVNENDGVRKAAEQIINIINSEKLRTDRQREVKEKFYE